jgi:purine-nucleoside phosphorylase
MEASTVFAVSSHFNVPSAASVYIGDNLVEAHTNLGEEYQKEADMRQQKQKQQIAAALDILLQ